MDHGRFGTNKAKIQSLTHTEHLNCCHAEFIFWKHDNMFESFLIEDENLFKLLSQYHGCWWPGNARSQCISGHGIDLVVPQHSGFVTTRVDFILIDRGFCCCGFVMVNHKQILRNTCIRIITWLPQCQPRIWRDKWYRLVSARKT